MSAKFINYLSMNLLSLSGLLLVFIGGLLSFFGSQASSAKSQSELTLVIRSKDTTIEELKRDSKTMKLDIEDRNAVIISLESEVKNIKEYSFYATYNILGSDRIAGGGIEITGDLPDRMKEIINCANRQANVKVDIALLPKINKIIALYPYYPFGYYAKYQLLKNVGNAGWTLPAKELVRILEITTTFKGHDESQDQVLAMTKAELRFIK